MTKSVYCILCALIALMAAPLEASDVSDAINAMRAGNFAEAYCVLKPYAESGDAEAQYNIGWMYLNGYGLMMNDSKALEWWQRASDQGYTDASFSIAMLYSLGEGRVERDMDKAIDYYMMAVEDGHEDANMIIRSMLARDDESIRQRKQEIVRTYGYLLGPYLMSRSSAQTCGISLHSKVKLSLYSTRERPWLSYLPKASGCRLVC